MKNIRELISILGYEIEKGEFNPNSSPQLRELFFGFLKVKDVVDKLAPKIAGRLLVFFPGSNENNNYRLLDGYDGWNYLAVPITADKDF